MNEASDSTNQVQTALHQPTLLSLELNDASERTISTISTPDHEITPYHNDLIDSILEEYECDISDFTFDLISERDDYYENVLWNCEICRKSAQDKSLHNNVNQYIYTDTIDSFQWLMCRKCEAKYHLRCVWPVARGQIEVAKQGLFCTKLGCKK